MITGGVVAALIYIAIPLLVIPIFLYCAVFVYAIRRSPGRLKNALGVILAFVAILVFAPLFWSSVKYTYAILSGIN